VAQHVSNKFDEKCVHCAYYTQNLLISSGGFTFRFQTNTVHSRRSLVNISPFTMRRKRCVQYYCKILGVLRLCHNFETIQQCISRVYPKFTQTLCLLSADLRCSVIIRKSAKDRLPAKMFERHRVELLTQRNVSAEFTTLFHGIFTAFAWENIYNTNAACMYTFQLNSLLQSAGHKISNPKTSKESDTRQLVA